MAKMKKDKGRIAVGSMVLAACLSAAGAGIDVVAVYYPHWHRYPKGDEWFHPGWTEWEYVKSAVPRFPGHNQPIVPTLGYLDGKNPADVAKEIDLAADAGIGVFLYDYYYYDGQITQEEAIEQGFLKAANRDRMKFALMWCYHDRCRAWRPEMFKERHRLMTLARTPEEFLGLIDYSIVHYFGCAEYWRHNGKIFFSIYNAGDFIKSLGKDAAKSALAEARRRVRNAGLGEMEFNAQNPWTAADVEMFVYAGFDSMTHYNANPVPYSRERYAAGERAFDYAETTKEVQQRYGWYDNAPIPYYPSVSTGWDATPRCKLDEPFPWKGDKENYPYCWTLTNATPALFERNLRNAKAFAEKDAERRGVVYINAWNEYTEGCYLVPDNFYGDGKLKAIAKVFARPERACGAAPTEDLNGEWTLDAFPQPADGAVRSLPLPEGLEVRRYRAAVPGCCEMELVKAGELPDPMFSTNAFAFMAYEGHQWLYGKRFSAPPRAAGERQVVVFDGIDTLADVFLNGEKIGETDNMLVAHEFDVTGKVKSGADNLLQVLIRPVGLAAADVLVGQLGHTMEGGADHERFRKAAYMYGWDIMPHLPVSGIWRGVRLETRPAARIEAAAWTTLAADRAKRTADVAFFARIVAPARNLHKAHVRCTLSRNGKVAAVRERTYHGPQTKVRMEFGDVDFWWPRGAGEPALYDAKAELVGADGAVLAADERKFGVRIVKLEYDDRKLPERPGRFLFTINGEPIYVRGINWVPLSPVPSQQAELLGGVLPMMADLNCNLVRVWGGGVYEPEAFYDWCDANGVMVWQDFMMGCTVPPQDDAFAETIRKEAMAVVLRLRSHPSIVLWAGDNENDLSAGWGLGRQNCPDPNLNRITREVLPRVVREYDVMRPYLPSSPFVSADAFVGRAEPSEDHLWGGPRAYWKHPYYTNSACWFCSEGGSHALPNRRSLERMMPAADVLKPWSNPGVEDCRDLLWTPQWIYHATNPYLDMDGWGLVHRNDHVLKQAGALFGDVERHDIDTLIAQTQSSQAESIKFQVELFRSQKFAKKGGFVVWNLRDGWPEISDAVCDWYGERKKSYRVLKASYRNVLPIITEDHRLVVVNDTLAPVKGRVKVTEAATGATVLEKDYEAPANGVLDLAPVAWDGQGVFLIDYTAGGEAFRTHYLHGEPPFKWSDYSRWTKEL